MEHKKFLQHYEQDHHKSLGTQSRLMNQHVPCVKQQVDSGVKVILPMPALYYFQLLLCLALV